MVWGVLLLSIPLLAVIAVLVYLARPFDSRLGEDEKLTGQLNELWRSGGSKPVRDLVGGDWDRVYVFQQEYLGRTEVERQVGTRVEMEDTFVRGRGASVLVFLKGNDVWRATWVDIWLHPGTYTADVVVRAPGYPHYLEFVEPSASGPQLAEDIELEAKRADLTRIRGSAPLRDLTGGDWDRVCVVNADTRGEVEQAVGSPVAMEPLFTKRGTILVFMKQGTVQRAAYVKSYLPDGVYSAAVRLDESRAPLSSLLLEP
ncbi:hypothetical protein ACWDYH_32570 [Nocardia goodfellowii]